MDREGIVGVLEAWEHMNDLHLSISYAQDLCECQSYLVSHMQVSFVLVGVLQGSRGAFGQGSGSRGCCYRAFDQGSDGV